TRSQFSAAVTRRTDENHTRGGRRPHEREGATASSMVPVVAARTLRLEVEGCEVVITNPDKVFFPYTGHTKIDLVNYYLAVADGALRGVNGRPMAMKRFVNG